MPSTLQRVMMTDVFNDDAQLYKEFTDNEGFRQWLTDKVFELTYAPSEPATEEPAADPKWSFEPVFPSGKPLEDPAADVEEPATTAPTDDNTEKWKDELMRLDVAILDLARTWRMPKARPNIIEDTPVTLRADYNRIFEMVDKLPDEQVEIAIKDLAASSDTRNSVFEPGPKFGSNAVKAGEQESISTTSIRCEVASDSRSRSTLNAGPERHANRAAGGGSPKFFAVGGATRHGDQVISRNITSACIPR